MDSPCDPVVSDDAVDGDGGAGVVDGKSETDARTPCGALDEGDEVGAADVEDVVLFGGRSVTIPAVATECGVPRGRSWVKLVLNSL